MERRPAWQFGQLLLLILILVAGSAIGVAMGYMIWNPGAANYTVISESEDATRTVRIRDISVAYPSVAIYKVGEDSSMKIEISNLDRYPEYVVVSLSLVHSSGVDSATISAITGTPYKATIAGYGSATNVLSFKPSAEGYAIFDITVKGELAGSITFYVVSSP
ncbi:MAG: hypothetical protein JSV57_03075 [Candidatus Bathyarchaeota archaeon]|nr:MAG: hypothetical protein JSV57_03075 [Candidatus Bathyarchaeota archaeon]